MKDFSEGHCIYLSASLRKCKPREVVLSSEDEIDEAEERADLERRRKMQVKREWRKNKKKFGFMKRKDARKIKKQDNRWWTHKVILELVIACFGPIEFDPFCELIKARKAGIWSW